MLPTPLSIIAWTDRHTLELSMYMLQSHPWTVHSLHTHLWSGYSHVHPDNFHITHTYWQAAPLSIIAWTAKQCLELSMYMLQSHAWTDSTLCTYTSMVIYNCYPRPSLSLHGQTDTPWNCPCTCCSLIHGQYTLYIHFHGQDTPVYTQTLSILHVHIGVIWTDRHPLEYINCYPHPSLPLHGQTDTPCNCPCTCYSHIYEQYTLYLHFHGQHTSMYTQAL